MKYYEALTRNFKSLRIIALFNPRIAYAGVALEIEIMFKEICEYVVRRKIEDSKMKGELADMNDGLQETAATQALLRECLESPPFKDTEMGYRLRNVRWLAGDYRHQRHHFDITPTTIFGRRIVFKAALDVVKLAEDFLRQLRLSEALLLRCPKCKHRQPFPFQRVLDAPCNESVKEECTKCGHTIFELWIPNPDNRSTENEEWRRLAVEYLADELGEFLLFQAYHGEITAEEALIKRKLLKTVVSGYTRPEILSDLITETFDTAKKGELWKLGGLVANSSEDVQEKIAGPADIGDEISKASLEPAVVDASAEVLRNFLTGKRTQADEAYINAERILGTRFKEQFIALVEAILQERKHWNLKEPYKGLLDYINKLKQQ